MSVLTRLTRLLPPLLVAAPLDAQVTSQPVMPSAVVHEITIAGKRFRDLIARPFMTCPGSSWKCVIVDIQLPPKLQQRDGGGCELLRVRAHVVHQPR